MCKRIMCIQVRRKAAGLSEGDLAGKMGVTKSTVQEWEKETYLPKTRELPALADALECSIDELFVGR